ncbi:MAG: hypothetical protein QOJ09_1416 [Actinomycetota bacterium]|nr:hypothetical protein [Actinomycetota bacterium]
MPGEYTCLLLERAGWLWSLQYLQELVERGSRPDQDSAAIESNAHHGVAVEAELLADTCGEVQAIAMIDLNHERASAAPCGRNELPARQPQPPGQSSTLRYLTALGKVEAESVIDSTDDVVPSALNQRDNRRERCQIERTTRRVEGVRSVSTERGARCGRKPQSGYLNTALVGYVPLSGGGGGGRGGT